MSKLFTYCIPYDDGAAPNPFWGVCTLAICKPAIRRVAEIGDWVVGTGSAHSPIGNITDFVVYAMKVTDKMTMREYDDYTKQHLPEKVPDWDSKDARRRLGDSIYDFSVDPPRQRKGVHDNKAQEHDLGGEYVLLSEHFFYFGDEPIPLPPSLLPIVKKSQGHRSESNARFLDCFEEWIGSLGYVPNTLVGNPQMKLMEDAKPGCAQCPSETDRGRRNKSCTG